MNLYKNTSINSQEILNAEDRQRAYYERFGNGDTQTYSNFAKRIQIQPAFQPNNPEALTYKVPRVLVDNSDRKIAVHTATDDPELLALALRGDKVWMSVFPQLYDSVVEEPYVSLLKTHIFERQDLTVIPTSSCRTVDVISSDAKISAVALKAMIKMHCPYFISRFDRRLGKGTIQHCITITRELKGLLETKKYPKFAILPDSIGVAFTGKNGWGYIVRESTPFPPVPDQNKRTMIPMFSLYGTDLLNPEAPLILTQMIDRAYERASSTQQKSQFAKEFVLDEIIFPLLDFFIVTYQETGILLELHGQNTLIEVDGEGLPTRLVHRDLDNAVDMDIRTQKGLSQEGFYIGQHISRKEAIGDGGGGSEQSLVFDKSIGRMNLDKLAEAVEKHYRIPKNELEEAAQKHFRMVFPEFKKYFPEDLATVYNYSSEMIPGKPNYYNIVPNQEDYARWRPHD